jgi:Ca2+-binding EF-hand superfamily protein
LSGKAGLLEIKETSPPPRKGETAGKQTRKAVSFALDEAEEGPPPAGSEEAEMRKCLLRTRSRIKDRMATISFLTKRANRNKQNRLADSEEPVTPFTDLTEAVQKAFRTAFQEAGEDSDGRLWAPNQIIRALQYVGLRGKTGFERQEVFKIAERIAIDATDEEPLNLQSFAFTVTPAVRDKLRQLRRSVLKRQFQVYDTDDNGWLSRNECEVIFECQCAWDVDFSTVQDMRKFFDAKVENLETDVSMMSFDGYEALVYDLQERVEGHLAHFEAQICRECRLDEEEMRHKFRQELLSIYSMFFLAAGPDRKVSQQHVRTLLIERGLMNSRHHAERGHGNSDDGLPESPQGERLEFKEFLTVLSVARADNKQSSLAMLQKKFAAADAKKVGVLTPKRVMGLVQEMGLHPRTPEEQAAMARLLVEADKDGNNEVSLEDFQALVLKIIERLRAAQRFRLRQVLYNAGLDQSALIEFLTIFHSIDDEGVGMIDAQQLWDHVLSSSQVKLALNDISELEETVEEECAKKMMDIEGFVRVMCKKWVPEKQRRQALSLED